MESEKQYYSFISFAQLGIEGHCIPLGVVGTLHELGPFQTKRSASEMGLRTKNGSFEQVRLGIVCINID